MASNDAKSYIAAVHARADAATERKPMITNEARAKLIGWKYRPQADIPWVSPSGVGWHHVDEPCPFDFDTDANAVAELRAFVRARGKEAEFAKQLSGFTDEPPSLFSVCFDVFIDATPAQQTKAFDAVFADDLEKL